MRIKQYIIAGLIVILTLISSISVYAETYDEFIVTEAINGYVSVDTETVTIRAAGGYLVGLSEEGPFYEKIIANVSEDELETVYYADEEGTCLGSADDYVSIDSTAPTITDIQTESSMPNVYFRSSGIYSDDDTELTLTVTAEDEESGIKSLVLYGEDEDGNTTTYESTDETTDDNQITATFTIDKTEDLFRSVLYVKVKDNVGNESELTLIDNTENESTLTIEDTAPTIGAPVIIGKKVNGWYSEVPHISSTITDTGSGLLNVKMIVNGTDTVYEEGFSDEDESFDFDVYLGGETEEEAEEYIRSREDELGGHFTATIIATDNCGNISSTNIDFNISLEKPNVTVAGVQDGSYYTTVPKIKISSDDKHADEDSHVIHTAIKKNGILDYTADIKGMPEYTLPADRFTDDAEYTVTTSVTGVSGIESDTKEISFTKDDSAAEIEIDSLDSMKNKYGWINSPVTFKFSVKDTTSGVESVEAYINESKVIPLKNGDDYEVHLNAEMIHLFANPDDLYTLKVTSEDKAGNTSSAELSVNIDIDEPVLTISDISSGSFIRKEKDLVLTSDDKNANKEGNSYHIVISKGDNIIYSDDIYSGSTYVIDKERFASDGNYTVTATTTDPAGNVSSEETISFTKDETAPELTIDQADKNKNEFGWLNTPVTFTFKASDVVSGIEKVETYINNEKVNHTAAGTAFSVDLTSSLVSSLINGNGTYTLKVIVTDRSGNTSSGEETVKIDIVKPVLSISGVDNREYIQKEKAVTLSSNDRNADKEGNRYLIVITRDGKNVRTDTVYSGKTHVINKSYFEKDGEYVIKSTTIDPAGNRSEEKSVQFTKDSTPPELAGKGVTGDTINKNGWFNKPLKYHFNASDRTSGISSVDISVNGNDIPFEKDGTSYSALLTKGLISSLINDDGVYKFEVTVTDRAGNKASINNSYKVDIVTPVLSISGITKDKHYKTNPVLSVKTNEKFYTKKGAFIKVIAKCDGQTVHDRSYVNTNSFRVSSFNRDGNYTVSVTEEDAAGNIAIPRSVSFVKDSTAPLITISGVSEGAFYNHTAVPKITVKERYYKTEQVKVDITRKLKGKTYSHSMAFSPAGEITSHSTSLSESGEYTVSVTAKDKAGNIASPKKISFRVDTQPPKVEILNVKDHGVYGYDKVVAPEILFSDDYLDTHKVTITRAGESWIQNLTKTESAGHILFSNFPKEKKNDGLYDLTVTVKDKAGNTTNKSIVFSVNRYGSTYQYMDDVEKYNNGYFQNVNDNLHVIEFNVNDLESTENIIKRDGKTVSTTNTYKTISNASGFKRFKHTFDSGQMEDEGVYTLDIISSDKAGNTTESAKDAGDIRIVVDRTKPTININGIEKRQYKAKSLEISVDSSDLLSPIHTEVKVNDVTIEPTHDNVYNIKEGINQTITVTSTDEAGNSNTVTENVSVTSNNLLYAALKYWLPIGIGVLLAMLALAVPLALLLSKEKHSK